MRRLCSRRAFTTNWHQQLPQWKAISTPLRTQLLRKQRWSQWCDDSRTRGLLRSLITSIIYFYQHVLEDCPFLPNPQLSIQDRREGTCASSISIQDHNDRKIVQSRDVFNEDVLFKDWKVTMHSFISRSEQILMISPEDMSPESMSSPERPELMSHCKCGRMQIILLKSGKLHEHDRYPVSISLQWTIYCSQIVVNPNILKWIRTFGKVKQTNA